MLKMEDKNISESMRVDTITNRLDKLDIFENKNLAYVQKSASICSINFLNMP